MADDVDYSAMTREAEAAAARRLARGVLAPGYRGGSYPAPRYPSRAELADVRWGAEQPAPSIASMTTLPPQATYGEVQPTAWQMQEEMRRRYSPVPASSSPFMAAPRTPFQATPEGYQRGTEFLGSLMPQTPLDFGLYALGGPF